MNKRRLISGGYAAFISILVIVIAVVINMVVSALPVDFTKFDTTGMGLYKLSEDTKELIKEIDTEVTLYLVAREGSENTIIKEFLRQYTKLNSDIELETIDPEISPSFATPNGTVHTLAQMTENSVIVSSELRDYVADYNSIFTVDYSGYSEEELYYYYSYYGQLPEGQQMFEGEQAVTSAIDNVTTLNLPILYTTTDHQEVELDSTLSEYVKVDNYEIRTLSLATGEGGVPADASCVLINAPQVDITANELEMLKSYVDGGGKLIVTKGYEEAPKADSNLKALAAYYGMELTQGIVLEGDINRIYRSMFSQNAYDIIPIVQTADPIASACSDYNVFTPMADGIIISDQPREGVSVAAVLSTSDSATVNNITDGSVIYSGSVAIAAHATVTSGETTGDVLWISSDYTFTEGIDIYGGNSALILSALGELCDKKVSVSIEGKVLDTDMLYVEPVMLIVIAAAMVLVIPLVIIVTGLVIWFIRRIK
ncbi:MAG: Gldg family protein [Clostridia bacterium]|nr:Gldg family protein [Clostridia bacterium]